MLPPMLIGLAIARDCVVMVQLRCSIGDEPTWVDHRVDVVVFGDARRLRGRGPVEHPHRPGRTPGFVGLSPG